MHVARAVDAFATARLTIVPARPELVDLELAGADRLAEAIRADLPDDWPPEHHDADLLRFVRAALDEPSAAGWWLHYLVLDEEGARVLVGTAGFKGPPAEGVVEIGYSVVASRQCRGIATEALPGAPRAGVEPGRRRRPRPYAPTPRAVDRGAPQARLRGRRRAPAGRPSVCASTQVDGAPPRRGSVCFV